MMKRLCKFISDYMGALVLMAAVVALIVPGAFSGIKPTVINPLLGVIMFGMGMALRLEDFRIVFSRPKEIIIGCIAQFTVMPLLALVLSRLFALDDALLIGVVLVGCCPGGTASNVITYLAKGDLALSVGMTATSTLLAPVMTPLLVWLLVGKAVDVDVAGMLLSILWVVILPIIAGLTVKWLFPQFTERVKEYLPAVSSLAIAFIVLIIISANASKLLLGGMVIIVVVMLHNLCGLGMGWLIGRLLHLPDAKRRAISIEVGMQNSGLASSLATIHFAAYPMASIPGAVFSVWHNISGSIVARLYVRMGKALMLLCIVSCGMAKGYAQDVAPYETYGLEKSMPVFYKQLKDSLKADWQTSQAQGVTREQVFATMQMAPPAPLDYSYEVIAEEQRDGYVAQKIAFNINRWERVLAYLLVPEHKSSMPAILLLHDHGAHFTIGKEKMVKPFGIDSLVTTDAEQWVGACYDGVYVGDELARQGYVVLCTDALFWGDRAPLLSEKDKQGKTVKEINRSLYDRQQALASNMLQMGSSWGAWITWDDIRSAAFLAHLPMVNPDRVGCIGFSMGAYRSWMLSALSDDIKASASICWMNDTEHLMTLENNQNKGGSAYSMLIPGIRNIADYPQVASLAAPKPTLFFNGKRDKLFPVEGVEASYDVMHKAWRAKGAKKNLITKLWDEKHFFSKAMQQEVFDFFKKNMK